MERLLYGSGRLHVVGLLLLMLCGVRAQGASGAAVQGAQAVAMTITSPQQFEVFQRSDSNMGTIAISGIAPAGCDEILYKLNDSDGWKTLMKNWASLRVNTVDSTFSGAVQAPGGGWYQLDVRAMSQSKVMLETSVFRIGIGEVFVVAGQSNSTNYGAEVKTPESPLVSAFDGVSWRAAHDPQPGVQDASTGGSFIPDFGDAMAEKYHVPIGVLSAGAGATSVRQWLPKGAEYDLPPTMEKYCARNADGKWMSTGDLFNGLIRRIAPLGAHGFRALLWHQGESDAHQPDGHTCTEGEYVTMLSRIIRESRLQAGWDFPWIVALTTFHSEADPSDPAIRSAQQRVISSGLAIQGPDTDKLGAEYRNGVHFKAAGQKAHGLAWAAAVESYIDPLISVAATNKPHRR